MTTFTNPTPASSDFFGHSLSAAGNDRVIIGAFADDTFAVNSGAAYLFNSQGTLLITFTNPTPAANDQFSNLLVAAGNDRVLMGAYGDDNGGTDSA